MASDIEYGIKKHVFSEQNEVLMALSLKKFAKIYQKFFWEKKFFSKNFDFF